MPYHIDTKGPSEPKIAITPRVEEVIEKTSCSMSSEDSGRREEHDEVKSIASDRREPRIVITPKSSITTGIQKPKIIIKPSTLQRNRDNRAIPKVS